MCHQLTFLDPPRDLAPADETSADPAEGVTVDTSALRKARGAFFTPPEMVSFIASWAIRSQNDVVLEPSCGEAAFLTDAARRLDVQGKRSDTLASQLHGVEVHAPSAAAALDALDALGFGAQIRTADFFDIEPKPTYDCVIGNPPYVRYQSFAGPARTKGLEAALKHGVRLSGTTNAWAAFVVHASQFLKPNGRLGLVLPAELLAVKYAAEVRRFLLQRFAKVRLVMFEELVFPGVLEDVVLLLAEGTGPAPCFEVHQARDVASLSTVESAQWLGFKPERDGKWTPALLPQGTFDAFQGIVSGSGFAPLLTWGDTTLGAVTGSNRFFTLTAEEAALYRIPDHELRRISPPGSRHLRGFTFSDAAWEEQSRDGAACYLFLPDAVKPSAAALRYIEEGEAQEVQTGYKCRNRKPWWRVPIVRMPDMLLTYMDHERPRMVTNEAKVLHLNSLYGVNLRHGLKELGRDVLPIATLNSVTLLAAEMIGRSYGGGLLKFEPTEADGWPVPSEATLREVGDDLRALRPQLATALRSSNVAAAVKLVDRVILTRHLKLEAAEISKLREAREALFLRRKTRGRGNRAEH